MREWVLLSHLIRGHEEPWSLISGPYHPPSIFFIGHPQRLKCIGSTKDPYVNIGYRTREGNLIRSCFIICSVDQLYVAQPVHKVFKAIASLEETWSYWLTGSFHPFKIQQWSLLLSVKSNASSKNSGFKCWSRKIHSLILSNSSQSSLTASEYIIYSVFIGKVLLWREKLENY